MKSNIVLMTILTCYFLLLGTVYTVWNLIDHGNVEWAGSTSILLSAGLTGFIAYYLAKTRKAQGGELIEDRLDSDIDDADPELGEFSPWSWWPIVLAGAASLVVLGLALGFNFWISFLAVPLLIVAVVGWTYEYYRGYFAR